MKTGSIDISGLKNPPEKQEFMIAKIFSDLGKNVVFIPPSNIPGVRQPDFKIDGEMWELKSPKGAHRRTIQNNIHKAQAQSKNIIIDLSRVKIDERKAVTQIKFEFEKRRSIEKIIIVLKNQKTIDLKRSK